MPSAAPIPPTLTNNLRRIGLLRLADDLNDVIARATKSRWGPVALLEALVAAETATANRRRCWAGWSRSGRTCRSSTR